MTANRPSIDEQIMHFADFVRGVSTLNSAAREFHSRLRTIEALARELPTSARLQARHFLVELTDGEFTKSELFRRARTRRTGHTGDYLLTDWIHLQHTTSGNPRGAFWDRFFHAQNAARSLRHRSACLSDELQRVYRRIGSGTRLLSVGCGPGRDLREALRQLDAGPGAVAVTGIDSDAEAIAYAREVMSPTMLQDVDYRQGDVGALPPDEPFDLVWCGHLMDHLDDSRASELLIRLWREVSPGGSLLLANFAATHRTRAWLEWCLEWPVNHRSEADMRRLLTSALGTHVPYRFDGDEWRTSHYLTLQKPLEWAAAPRLSSAGGM